MIREEINTDMHVYCRRNVCNSCLRSKLSKSEQWEISFILNCESVARKLSSLESKKKISIEIMLYVCCMQHIQHIFDRFKHRWSVWSSLARQTSAYSENEKNFKLHSQMSMQLSWESRNIAEVWWINEWHARGKCKHITEISHFINSLSILQRKSDQEVRSTEN